MTSPFSTAEMVGGPWDGATYERRGKTFPLRLTMRAEGVTYLYEAGMGRLGSPVYRLVAWFLTGLEIVK